SNLTIKIKSKVQKKLLDKIVDLAEQGIWHKGLFSSHVMMKDSGVCGYVKKAKLNKKIGKWSKIKGATEITKMSCFEAICLGIMKSSKKDMTCATKFVESD